MIRPPAPRPCASCPYRRDVPSGVWAAEEYAKLPAYDRPTMEQPPGVFLCHQHDRDSTESRACAGWAGCHDGDELLALRVAGMRGTMTVETVEAVRGYVSPVPLFGSGAEAAEHGMTEIKNPSPEAVAAMEKIGRRRELRDLLPYPTTKGRIMIDPDESCEFCLDVATTLAGTSADPTTIEQTIEAEYAAIHAHAHPDEP